jgi:localization factor PodJL
MNRTTASDLSSVLSQARRLAEEAADRAGVSLEEWLDEAILRSVAGATARATGGGTPSSASEDLGQSLIEETEDLIESAMDRLERRMRRSEERMARALGSLTSVFNAARENADGAARAPEDRGRPATPGPQPIETHGGRPEPLHEVSALNRRLEGRLVEIARRMDAAGQAAQAPNASPDAMTKRLRLDLQAAVSQMAVRRQAPPPSDVGSYSSHAASRSSQDVARAQRTAGARADHGADGEVGSASEWSEGMTSGFGLVAAPGEDIHAGVEESTRSCKVPCAVDLTAMREGIAAMSRSLAELAPRNAVVALEGAVRDLSERVALLRRDGESETLLAPLDVMADELRTSLKSWDPQAAVAHLEREISSLAGKVEALAEAAVNPERFDRIQRHTEEVRNLLAVAASRSAPLEHLERQIGKLADRIEGLSASQAPQAETAQMAASLAELRREIERSTPISTLTQIERRLDHIAARLDEELPLPAHKATEPCTLEDLARRIEDVHQSLNAGLQSRIDTGALEASLRELSANIENRVAEPFAALVRDISDKLDSAGRRDAQAAPVAVEPMLAEISAKLDRLHDPDWLVHLRSVERVLIDLDSKLNSEAGRPLDRRLLSQIAEAVAQRLEKDYSFRIDAQGLAEQIAYVHDRLEELPRLDELRGLARRLSAQLDSLAGVGERNDGVEAPSSPERTRPEGSSAFPARGIEALDAIDSPSSGAPPFKPTPPASTDDAAALASAEEDILLEPGAGAPHRVREGREPTREVGPKTSPSISIHIAAARRAAHSATSEGSGHSAPAEGPAVARGVERAKSLYATHKRPVILAAAFAIVAFAAVRLIGVYAPAVQKSELIGHPAKMAGARSAHGATGDLALGASPVAPKVDPTPTASIPPWASSKSNVSGGAAGPELSASLSAALPTPLRDAIVAGSPAAEYELAQRLLEGRGLPQDQEAAALWFERAASSGLAPAQFRLAILYSRGVGRPRDDVAARRWYEKAAEAGNAQAAHNLAVSYAEPVGEKPDYVKAAKWFRKAAELGVRDSQFNLAILYARGLGVDQDLRRSWMWFSLAAAQGDADAARKRDEIAARMTPDALSAAAGDVSAFKPVKPDAAANDVAPPPGGWDGNSAASPPGDTRPTASAGARSAASP